MLEKNQIHTVSVTDMNDLGYGVARIDGMVVFIDGGVSGDLLEIKLIKVSRDYAVARIEKILTPSSKRIEPDCPVFKRCGGCAFRHISYEYELELKRSFVLSAFKKQGIEACVSPVVCSGIRDGYRNKVQYPVGKDGEYGYYARHSHDIVKCDVCALADPELDPIARFVSDYIKKSGARIKHIYIRRARGTGQIMLCPVSPDASLPNEESFVSEACSRFPEIKSIVLNIHPEQTNVILGKKTRVLYGKDLIEDRLCGCLFGISSLSFYQVNRDGAEILYREAIKRAEKGAPTRVLDLYCGAGTVGLSYAKAHPEAKVTGIEIVPEAVENARRNAGINGVRNAEFICADAMNADIGGYDCIFVDPPRKGMSRELADKLCADGPEKIVYISCNPQTLARDASLLIGGGYQMSEVTPVDMFSRTGAIECVTLFTRKG